MFLFCSIGVKSQFGGCYGPKIERPRSVREVQLAGARQRVDASLEGSSEGGATPFVRASVEATIALICLHPAGRASASAVDQVSGLADPASDCAGGACRPTSRAL
jgi:hypothetical protein